VPEAAALVRQAVVLVAIVDVALLPAFLHGSGADDGAEGHGERDDDHGEWFDHLGGFGDLSGGERWLGGCFLEMACGGELVFGWLVGLKLCWIWCLRVLMLVQRYEIDSLAVLCKD
jgi:hypothetical protein